MLALPAWAAPAAPAAVTIGPPLSGYTPSYSTLACGGCTLFNVSDGFSQSAASPIDGVVVRWRLLSDFIVQTNLRIIRPDDAGHVRAVATSAPALEDSNDPQPIATRLRIARGDFVGIDVASTSRAIVPGGWTMGETLSPLVDGGDPAGYYHDADTLLLQADIEPDADGDGYGDETQDLCPSDASTHATCPVSPPPPQTTITTAAPAADAGSTMPASRTPTPSVSVSVPRQHLAAVVRFGLRINMQSTIAGTARLTLTPSKADARRLHMRPGTLLATARVKFLAAGRIVARLRFKAALRRRIETHHALHLFLRVTLDSAVATRRLSLTP
jgi:hypothetical protein